MWKQRDYTTAAILVMTCGTVYAASWHPVNTGLPVTVSGATALTVDPAVPSTIYARTSYGGVFKSTDSGGSWKALSNVTGVNSIIVDFKDSSTVYAATFHGVVKS